MNSVIAFRTTRNTLLIDLHSLSELNCFIPKTGLQCHQLSKHWKYEKRLQLRCIHHFKSDLNNNMDHMRI